MKTLLYEFTKIHWEIIIIGNSSGYIGLFHFEAGGGEKREMVYRG